MNLEKRLGALLETLNDERVGTCLKVDGIIPLGQRKPIGLWSCQGPDQTVAVVEFEFEKRPKQVAAIDVAGGKSFLDLRGVKGTNHQGQVFGRTLNDTAVLVCPVSGEMGGHPIFFRPPYNDDARCGNLQVNQRGNSFAYTWSDGARQGMCWYCLHGDKWRTVKLPQGFTVPESYVLHGPNYLLFSRGTGESSALGLLRAVEGSDGLEAQEEVLVYEGPPLSLEDAWGDWVLARDAEGRLVAGILEPTGTLHLDERFPEGMKLTSIPPAEGPALELTTASLPVEAMRFFGVLDNFVASANGEVRLGISGDYGWIPAEVCLPDGLVLPPDPALFAELEPCGAIACIVREAGGDNYSLAVLEEVEPGPSDKPGDDPVQGD